MRPLNAVQICCLCRPVAIWLHAPSQQWQSIFYYVLLVCARTTNVNKNGAREHLLTLGIVRCKPYVCDRPRVLKLQKIRLQMEWMFRIVWPSWQFSLHCFDVWMADAWSILALCIHCEWQCCSHTPNTLTIIAEQRKEEAPTTTRIQWDPLETLSFCRLRVHSVQGCTVCAECVGEDIVVIVIGNTLSHRKLPSPETQMMCNNNFDAKSLSPIFIFGP